MVRQNNNHMLLICVYNMLKYIYYETNVLIKLTSQDFCLKILTKPTFIINRERLRVKNFWLCFGKLHVYFHDSKIELLNWEFVLFVAKQYSGFYQLKRK